MKKKLIQIKWMEKLYQSYYNSCNDNIIDDFLIFWFMFYKIKLFS